MASFFKKMIFIIFSLSLVSACTPSKEKAFQETENTITTVFKHRAYSSNVKTTDFAYYKPTALAVFKKTEDNIIFQGQNKNIYLLFVNPNEDMTSQLDYQSIKRQKRREDLLKSLSVDNKFVYVYVQPLKGDMVELVIGAGGVKMATKTRLQDLNDQAKLMSQMIHSVTIEKKKKKADSKGS